MRALRLKVVELNQKKASLAVENKKLRSKLHKANEYSELRYKPLRYNHKKFKFYTGLSKTSIYDFIVDLLSSAPTFCKLNRHDHLLVILVKLRLGLTNKDIAYRFSLPESIISNILRNWFRLPNHMARESCFDGECAKMLSKIF